MSDNVYLLDEAEDALVMAIDNIKAAVRGTSQQAMAEAYIIPHLESWISGSDQMITIDSMRQALTDEFEFDDEDFDDEDDFDNMNIPDVEPDEFDMDDDPRDIYRDID